MSARIAVITSRFNEPVTSKLFKGATERLKACNIPEDNIDAYFVPGAVEIPLIAQECAKQHRYHAIIALGAVIRGETSHYDYVCKQVSDGCQQVMMEFELPVIFGVLTTENAEQAFDRVGGNHGHKGEEAADAALEMIELMEQIKHGERDKELV